VSEAAASTRPGQWVEAAGSPRLAGSVSDSHSGAGRRAVGPPAGSLLKTGNLPVVATVGWPEAVQVAAAAADIHHRMAARTAEAAADWPLHCHHTFPVAEHSLYHPMRSVGGTSWLQ
jgi:hypothetical protein